MAIFAHLPTLLSFGFQVFLVGFCKLNLGKLPRIPDTTCWLVGLCFRVRSNAVDAAAVQHLEPGVASPKRPNINASIGGNVEHALALNPDHPTGQITIGRRACSRINMARPAGFSLKFNEPPS